MNSLKKNLSDSKYHSIWLNTWEYALMKDAQSTLMDIIIGLIQETSKVTKVDDSKTNKILKTLWSGIKDTSKVITKNALNKGFDGEGKSTIGEVRKKLEVIIKDWLSSSHKCNTLII